MQLVRADAASKIEVIAGHPTIMSPSAANLKQRLAQCGTNRQRKARYTHDLLCHVSLEADVVPQAGLQNRSLSSCLPIHGHWQRVAHECCPTYAWSPMRAV